MRWTKIKHLFVAEGQSDWMHSHASNPVYVPFKNSADRIYFSCRDKQSRSYIAFLEVDVGDGFRILSVSDSPVLSPGPLGTFDDSGAVVGTFQWVNGRLYMYYLGWNLKVTVPWQNSIGLAIQNEDSDEFTKFGKAPILDRSQEDPYSISYPSVLLENGEYRMWYGSNLNWGKEQHQMQHVFKYASSDDGINWSRTGKVVLNHIHYGEYALSKPWVIKDGDLYKMWYSYRGNGSIDTYRIGYAESSDGLEWKRKDDEVGIDVSDSGWDSQMISYPCIFDFEGKRYMLYNGNEYGKAGFGVAVLSS